MSAMPTVEIAIRNVISPLAISLFASNLRNVCPLLVMMNPITPRMTKPRTAKRPVGIYCNQFGFGPLDRTRSTSAAPATFPGSHVAVALVDRFGPHRACVIVHRRVAGRGTLTFHGRRYSFSVSGLSAGASGRRPRPDLSAAWQGSPWGYFQDVCHVAFMGTDHGFSHRSRFYRNYPSRRHSDAPLPIVRAHIWLLQRERRPRN
jgi:hypothetical protein